MLVAKDSLAATAKHHTALLPSGVVSYMLGDAPEVVLPGLCAARRVGAPINTAPGRACKDLLQVRLGRFLCRPASSPLALRKGRHPLAAARVSPGFARRF